MNIAPTQNPTNSLPAAAVPPLAIESVIELVNLKKSFGEQSVLNDVSLALHQGENLVVMGKSGSGKSVLLQCIVRLLAPDSGTITVLGQDVEKLHDHGLSELRKKIGYLFQSGALYDSMTVRENLEFPLRRANQKFSQTDIDNKIKEALEHVGLPDSSEKLPSQLSGGMRKRISLARTVVVDPAIMLYDEPTTGLDPVTANEISTLINDVQKKYRTSSLIVTHDIRCARTTANRAIMLQDGRVYLEGAFDSFENSSDPVIRSFFK